MGPTQHSNPGQPKKPKPRQVRKSRIRFAIDYSSGGVKPVATKALNDAADSVEQKDDRFGGVASEV